MTSSRNHFLPDTRTSIATDSKTVMAEGFGLRWRTTNPPGEATIRHAQKLLQVDREIGLGDFIDQQRSTFSIEDNMKAITTQKKLMDKPTQTQGKPDVGGVVGLAFGILATFATTINREVVEEQKR